MERLQPALLNAEQFSFHDFGWSSTIAERPAPMSGRADSGFRRRPGRPYSQLLSDPRRRAGWRNDHGSLRAERHRTRCHHLAGRLASRVTATAARVCLSLTRSFTTKARRAFRHSSRRANGTTTLRMKR